jgi:hypothetical protein
MLDGKPVLAGRYYHAWGHPAENNCSEESIRQAVEILLKDEDCVWIAHNLAFDAAILTKKWNLKFPWHRSSCTMLKAFLHDPYGELSLKPLAAKLLNMPAEEQEAVRAWLIAHGICASNSRDWGAHIMKAPGNLVGAYAYGDIDRTEKLHVYYEALK